MKVSKKTGGLLVVSALLSMGYRSGTDRLQALTAPVNIYLSDTLLYICDTAAGIFVYSVRDRAAPLLKTVIPVRGNSGVAARGDIIYANSYDAILALRVTSDTTYEVTSVIKQSSYTEDYLYSNYDYYRPSGFISCGVPLGGMAAAPLSASEGGGGMGGSYAVFAVIDSFLYYIDDHSLITMDISRPHEPQKLSETYVDESIETLFPTPQHLFIGGTSGMYVFDRSNPALPVRIGTITHFRAYDPVVVQDTVAFVTLRTGPGSPATRGVLLTVSIADPAAPVLLKEIACTTPYGLSVNDTLLYVSNGLSGFMLYNVADPWQPAAAASWQVPVTKDFIWTGNTLYVMGFDDVRIFDVTDPFSPGSVAIID